MQGTDTQAHQTMRTNQATCQQTTDHLSVAVHSYVTSTIAF